MGELRTLNTSAAQDTVLNALIARQRAGWSLEQPFYTSSQIFDIERRGWLAKQWYLLGHRSETSSPGSYIVRELLGESLIIVRDSQGVLRGFYNVCRHRGSRICDRDGRSNSLVCPYHGWSYLLDGSLRSAAGLPAGLNLTSLSLHPLPVREVGGLILVSLTGNPANAEHIARELEPGFRFHGILTARIAARRHYPTHANWKLVFENFVERFITGGRPGPSHDGQPVAPPMGQRPRVEGGISTVRCEPFIFLAALRDHAVVFRFSPIAAEETGLEVTWLVNSSAREADVDLERMTRPWDVTILQDKELIERNAAGVRSRAYTPGPYSELEDMPARFVSRYLGELREP